MTEPAYVPAVRTAYDTVAVDYAERLGDELDRKPLDRALLATFAELVRADGGGPVADLGCGPGRVATVLHGLGLDAIGVDLSPVMLAIARKAYPELRFVEGLLTALPIADGALAGALAWYSIIHTPPEQLPAVFAEFARVLAPDGHLLVAHQAGDDELVHLERGFGHEVSLDVYRLSPDRVVERLRRAGFVVHSRVRHDPPGPESNPQAYLLARKPQRP
ncbi:methyltransferase domain-containing protein [Micromonospora sp. NPDC049559]|uniref:class I SAM-dependent DNA methyltransferase n=1 Tax=Micromonospora sp. NPDC049559 TaxID=3155923 RepID=UPI00341B6031